jgi:putative hemolysin
MAFVTVSKPKLRKLANKGDKRAQHILNLRTNPERILSVLQIGITLVGAISAAVGGAGAEESISPIYQTMFNISEDAAESLAIFTIVVPITYFSVVIGELVPKTLALRFPLKFAMLGTYFLSALDRFFSPVVFLLEMSTKLLISPVVRLLGSESDAVEAPPIEIDGLSDSHKQYVINLITIEKKRLKDIVVPWDSVTKIEKSAHYSEVMELIRAEQHTRIPVVEDENPVGILHAKEFISEVEVSKMDWTQLIRPLVVLSSEDAILNGLKVLQAKKSHMAIIRSKAGILGIATIEDIIEEIVGDIHDESENPNMLLASNSKLRKMHLPDR